MRIMSEPLIVAEAVGSDLNPRLGLTSLPVPVRPGQLATPVDGRWSRR
jgi:hypothetical protein